MSLTRAALLLALPALLLAAGGCRRDEAASPTGAQPQAVAAEARPALWKVSDEDSTIYLLGSIHVLPKGYSWQNGRIPDAIAAANRLTLETIIPEDPQAAAGLLLGLGQAPGLPPILERVSPDKRPLLKATLERSRLPASFLDGLETWAAGFMLMSATMNDLGLDADNGVEEELTRGFEARAKPIDGLETMRQQLGYFDTLPEADQRAFLEGVLDDPAAARREYDRMLSAWAHADLKAIAHTFDEELDATPNLRAVLIARRNATWAEQIEKRIAAEPGTALVAVGAGHLAGSDSLPELLKKDGLRVERLQ